MASRLREPGKPPWAGGWKAVGSCASRLVTGEGGQVGGQACRAGCPPRGVVLATGPVQGQAAPCRRLTLPPPRGVASRHASSRRPRPDSTPAPMSRPTSRRAATLADAAAAGGARLVALPEYLQYRGPDDGYRASARPVPGPTTEPFAEVARRRGAWILVGSVAEASSDPDRPYNTSVLIDPDWRDRGALPQDPPVRRGRRRRSGRHGVGPRLAGGGAGLRGRRRRPVRPERSATTCASRSCTAHWRWPVPRS